MTDAQSEWDVVGLAGHRLPGKSRLKALPTVRDLDTEGYIPGPIEVEVLLSTDAEVSAFAAFLGDIGGRGPIPVQISHPGLDAWNITSVVIEHIAARMEAPGTWLITIKAVEWR